MSFLFTVIVNNNFAFKMVVIDELDINNNYWYRKFYEKYLDIKKLDIFFATNI